MGYDSGTYHEALVLRASGKPQWSTGSYLTIYRRGRDGRWLIVEQIWAGAIHDGTEPAQEGKQ